MKKKSNRGFMLAETLVVTTFVAGVLIFLFIQFTTLNNSYNDYYLYNTTENLYALEDIKDYIQNNNVVMASIVDEIDNSDYVDITDCEIFVDSIDKEYCLKLLELEEIGSLLVLSNPVTSTDLNLDDDKLSNFIRMINSDGEENYRLVAKFNDGTFATLRFYINLEN